MNQDISKVKSIGELASQIIRANRYATGLTGISYLTGHNACSLHLFGQDPCRAGAASRCNISVICTERDNMTAYDVLFNIFEELQDRGYVGTRALRYVNIQFIDFDFTELPSNLGRVLPHVKHCYFIRCPKLSSLATTVEQFLGIQLLICRGCSCLTSLSSLEALPLNSSLYNLAFKNCGLRVTADDDWESGLRAIGTRPGDNRCILTIQNCDQLTILPPSIIQLKRLRRASIILVSNTKLRRLPSELGDIQNLELMQCNDCPQVKLLPWTLSRIPNCSISVNNNADLLDGFRQSGIEVYTNVNANANAHDEPYFKGRVRELEPYFKDRRRRFTVGIIKLKIHLHRAGRKAVDRLYRPGGAGFKRSREHFEMMASKELGSRDGK